MPEWLIKILAKCKAKDDGTIDFTSVSDEVSKALSKRYVDMETYQNVSAQLTTANGTIAELQKVDVSTLQQELADEKAGRAQDKQTYALSTALIGAGCTDVDYALYKCRDKATFNEDGTLKDADAFINLAKETCAPVFAQEEPHGTGGAGNFARNRDHTKTKEEIAKMTYTELAAYMAEHPDAEI